MSAAKLAAVVALLGATGALLPAAGPWSRSWLDAGGAPLAWAAGLVVAVALCAPLAARLHALLFRPLELLRSPDEVGYIAEDGRTKARAANEVRRRRRTGDLPPIYPNGWYRVLDSHLLARGGVKSVSILGSFAHLFN